MASNATVLADEDREYPDWIEIYNPDSTAVNLNGWYISDNATNKKKWAFPSRTIPSQGYLVVFASGKDRRDPAKPLHTNFSLDADGEYLALVRPDGVTVTTEFAPSFPEQRTDVSYGAIQSATGATTGMAFLQTPTPGARNSAAQKTPLTEIVTFSRSPGSFTTTFNLTLSGAGAGQQIRYVLVAPSATGSASPEPTATSTKYNGPLTVSTSVVVKAAVFTADDSNQGTVTRAQFVKIAATSASELSSFSSGLPVLILDDHGAGPLKKDAVDHEGWFYRYPSKGKTTPVLLNNPDVAVPATMTVRGSSSAGFPKKSYSLDLLSASDGKAALPLVGSVAAKKWALIGPWYFDQTSIKNSFMYTLSNRIGRWAPAVQPTEMYFHTSGDLSTSDYAGIYLLTERIDIDPEKVNITPLGSGANADITGGYLIKLDSPDTGEFSFSTTRDVPGGNSQVIVASASDAELSTAQKDYVHTYIQTMEDTLVADYQGGFATRKYLDYIDRASWVDHHILNVFSSNFDALERSAYFSKDRGGKLVAGPIWDYDRSFGNATFYATVPSNRWFVEGGVNFWQTGWWGWLSHDPEFLQDWVDRWQSLRQGVLSLNSLNALADSLTATIGPEAMARDLARWPMNTPEYTPGLTGGVTNMKAWFANRVAWIDDQFVAPPAVSSGGTSLTFSPATGAQMAYTLDGSDPRSLGGKLAPNAQLTSAPLVLSSTTNVHVRSYRADREGVFPGSPWSSAVGGANSSPLSPAARLVNISARALVGTGENVLIAGIVVSDTAQKSYLVRGVGPTLGSLGVANTLPDPELSIRRSDSVEIYKNTGWRNGPDVATLPAVFQSVGAFPFATTSVDSALLPQVPAGTYTVRVSSPTGKTGTGLAELYETSTAGRTTNLSVRVNVQPGEGALFGGFVIQGPAYKRVLVRGIGPTLKAFGVTNALVDPILTIYSGQTVVATNDAWSSGTGTAALSAASASVGAFALAAGTEDAALLITLPPGAYTVKIEGKNAASGVALLEIYEVP